jgi:uncharacterized protein YceK
MFYLVKTIFLAACLLISGCVNVLCTRNPLSDSYLQDTYQSTRISLMAAHVAAFPQVMSSSGHDDFMWENIFTIPVGCVILVDSALEAVVDTICLPVDWPLTAHRKKIWAEHDWWQSEEQIKVP